MSTKIQDLQWSLKRLVGGNKEWEEKADELLEYIKQANRLDVELFTPTRRFDVTHVNVSDYSWGDDYNILTGTVTVTIKNEEHEVHSEKEFEELIQEKAGETFDAYEAVSYYELDGVQFTELSEARAEIDRLNRVEHNGVIVHTYSEIETYWQILDGDRDCVEDSFNTEEEADERIEELKKEWIEEQGDFNDYNFRYDEIAWSTVWNFDGDIDVEVASSLGLGVLEFVSGEHEGTSFLFLTGAGMDMTPDLIAYKALVYELIDVRDTSYLQTKNDRNYFRHVVNTENYVKVLKTLGIYELVIEIDGELK